MIDIESGMTNETRLRQLKNVADGIAVIEFERTAVLRFQQLEKTLASIAKIESGREIVSSAMQ